MTQSEHFVFAVLADCYTPILLLIALVEVGRSWIGGNKLHVVKFVYAVVVVYFLMFVDKYFQLWAIAGLDYSTHSAAAVALVALISPSKNIAVKLTLVASLFGYGCLMNLLNYHNWGDMLTTVLALVIILAPALTLPKSSKTSFLPKNP